MMINQIRADIYRQIHTIGFYIVLICTLALSMYFTGIKRVGGLVISDETVAKQLENLSDSSWTALSGIKAMTMLTSLLLYIYIALFVIIIGYEFSQKTYKNTLISGISRLQFIGAKYIVLFVDLLVLVAMFYTTSILSSLIVGRAMGESFSKLVFDASIMTLAVAFFMSVIFSIGIILLIATGSTIIPAVFIVIWPVTIAVLSTFTQWSWLRYFDFVTIAEKVALSNIPVQQLWTYISISAAVLVTTIVGSSIVIRIQEL